MVFAQEKATFSNPTRKVILVGKGTNEMCLLDGLGMAIPNTVMMASQTNMPVDLDGWHH